MNSYYNAWEKKAYFSLENYQYYYIKYIIFFLINFDSVCVLPDYYHIDERSKNIQRINISDLMLFFYLSYTKLTFLSFSRYFYYV